MYTWKVSTAGQCNSERTDTLKCITWDYTCNGLLIKQDDSNRIYIYIKLTFRIMDNPSMFTSQSPVILEHIKCHPQSPLLVQKLLA